MNDVRLIGQPTRHISSNINSNFGIEQLKAWKKLYTSGFETDFEYIRTLSFNESYNGMAAINMNTCTVAITPNTTKNVTVTHGTFVTTFIGDVINAPCGTTGGSAQGNRNQLLNIIPLIPSVKYIVEGSNYIPYVTYTTDALGRVNRIEATLRNGPSKRDNTLS